MTKWKSSLIIIAWAILGIMPVSWAQTGSRWERAAYNNEAGQSVVRVYGPDALTDLAEQAILEKRPDVAVVKYSEQLANKVRIEGTTGSDYMPLSPKRVKVLKAARARGGSVYSALCSEQKGVIHRTVGVKKVTRTVERKVYRTRYYTRVVCLPPPAVYVAPVSAGYAVGGYYPFYGYAGYGGWGVGGYGGYYAGGFGHRSFHHGGHHHSGGFHRGH